MLHAPIFYVIFFFDSVADLIGSKAAISMVAAVISAVIFCVSAYWVHNKMTIFLLVNFKTDVEMITVDSPLRDSEEYLTALNIGPTTCY
jgi:hypothetical protein